MKYNEIVSAYDQPIRFIVGFAGSGKSTRLVELCKDDHTLVVVPTHEAGKVLQGKGIKNVFTIHSILRLVPTIDENFRKGQKLQKLNKIGKVDLSTITEIAIDEFSMINTKILDMLLELLPSHCEVIVFGDASQLPPVDGDSIDPYNYTSDIDKLTTQHRADNPSIVETFMRFHHYIETGTGMDLTVKLPTGTIEGFDPNTDRILAYTNDRVMELNTAVAVQLGLPEAISVGESILMNGITAELVEFNEDYPTIYPTCVSKGMLMAEDKLYLAVAKTRNDIDKFGTEIPYNRYSVRVEDEYYNIHINFKHYNKSKELKKAVEDAQHNVIQEHNLDKDIHLPTWCREHSGYKGVKERSWAWSTFLTHQNLVFDVRRPFATTVHKAQGKEFNKIYLDQEDIKKSIRNNYYLTYARLMYVGLSRAIKEIIILR
jgi:hypothetical protein